MLHLFRALRTGSLLSVGLLMACVTINIYFPAAAAEKAADRIIRDVWGEDAQPTPPTPPASTPPSSWLLDLLIPAAHAQNIDISSPAINQLKSAMSARHGQLQPFYTSGAVGLTGDGLLAVRDLNAVPLNQRNPVNQLVAAENRDRQALYKEIAAANGHPEWARQIQETFARQWIAKAPSGWWYQAGGSWKQK